MTNIEKVIKGLECCSQGGLCAGNCPYDSDDDDYIEKCTGELTKDALELLKEQQVRKSKDEVLTAIISTQGYVDVETFKRTVLEIDNFEDYFLGGLFRAVKAVEKLFETH